MAWPSWLYAQLTELNETSRHLPHPGPHTLGPVVCRLLLMLLCCTGGMVGIERLIGDYRRCNYEHEIAMGWWSTEAAVEALAVD